MLWVASLIVALALSAVPARADDPAAAGDRETVLREKANALMASSNWKEAQPLWAELYGLAGDPIDLWNAAVCQYHLAQSHQATPDQALALLQQYRDSPNVPDEKKAKAQRYIDEMTVLKQQQTAVAAAPVPAPVATTSAPVPLPGPAPLPETDGSTLRMAAWTTGGVGVAALMAGIYFSVRTHSLNNKVTSEMTFDPSDDSAGHQAETLQFVMYGVGAAAVATAGVLYYYGSRHHEPPSLALVPAVGPRQSGAVLTVRF